MSSFIKQVLSGKTIGRILMNRLVQAHAQLIEGNVLDLASTKHASYHEHLSSSARIIVVNNDGEGADVVADFDKPFPFDDGEFDTILFFNALYIVEDREALYGELKRVLKEEGRLFIVMPLIANEMREPHDYCRLTYEGLETELKCAGFSRVQIIRFGERFSAAAHLLHSAFLFSIIRLLIYPIALLFDKLIPSRIKKEHPTPIGYFVIARK